MREQLAGIVHAVLSQGLNLRQRLLQGEDSALAAEQVALVSLLREEHEARRLPEFGGDDPDAPQRRSSLGREEALTPRALAPDLGQQSGDRDQLFLGARYALVCWLDEMFILDSPWSVVWNEHKLEVALYSSNDRAWRFWEQARLAAKRGYIDALEVFYLCVMLGFSGELLEDTARLAEWTVSTRALLSRHRQGTWRPPLGPEPATSVHPLRGRASLRRLLLVATSVLLVLVPIVALVLARRLS